jgi:hypothetical protein
MHGLISIRLKNNKFSIQRGNGYDVTSVLLQRINDDSMQTKSTDPFQIYLFQIRQIYNCIRSSNCITIYVLFHVLYYSGHLDDRRVQVLVRAGVWKKDKITSC